MAKTTKQLLSEFLAQRAKNFDTPNDPFKPVTESFVNIDLPEVELSLRNAQLPRPPEKVGDFARVPDPAGPLKVDGFPKTNPAGLQPSLPISPTSPAGPQPSLETPLARPPAGPIDIDDPARTRPAAQQPSLGTSLSRPPAGPIDIGNLPQTNPADQQPSLEVELSKPLAEAIVIDELPRSRPPTGKIKDPNNKEYQGTVFAPLPIQPVPDTLRPSLDVDKLLGGGKSQLEGGKPFHVGPAGLGPVPLSKGGQDPSTIDLPNERYTNRDDIINETAGGARTSRFDPNTNLDFAKRLRNIDSDLFRYIKSVGDGSTLDIVTEFGNPDGSPYAPVVGGPFGMQGGQSWNPILFAKSVVRLGVHLKLGLITFGAIQLGLHLLNPVKQVGPRVSIWNPLTLANPPLLQNFIPSTINAIGGLFTHQKQIEEGGDIHKQMAEGKYDIPFQPINGLPPITFQTGIGSVQTPINAVLNFLFPRLVGAPSQAGSILETSTNPFDIGKPIVQAALEARNIYNDAATVTDFPVFNINDLVDEVLNKSPKLLVEDPTLTTPNIRRYKFPSSKNQPSNNDITPGGVVASDPGLGALGKLFFNPNKKIAYPTEFRPQPGIRDNAVSYVAGDLLFNSAYTKGIIPVRFKQDNESGFITSPVNVPPSTVVPDDEAYVPLSFTDLRPIGNKLRTVYFRPFITDLREDFQPDWNKTHYLGRSDYVATYQSTGRTIGLGFQIHAFGPEDVEQIYNKINWLASMVMPQYDSNLAMVSGPVVRLRIGDVVSSKSGLGLPGIIENLNYDYGGALWELTENFKVPRSIKISLNFHVLHDRPIGIGAGGRFGGIGTINDLGAYIPPSPSDAVTNEPGGKVKFPKVADDFAGGFRSFPKNFNKF